MNKFADYPVVMIDLYGRERHPEYTDGEYRDEESYSARRERIDLMLKTYSYVPDGIPPDSRYILVDVDQINLTERTGSTTTVVTQMWGRRPQFHHIIDLNGKVIHSAGWENVTQADEVLSNIFGLEPGL